MAGIRALGRRKSAFPAKTAVPAGATLDFVSGGVNYKIPIEDLIVALGATGTIVQDGDPLGTPVLDIQGAVNNIRNLENGSGVKASVSAQNGVTLDHNFQTDATGVGLVVDLSVDSPKFRSLIAGDGINISAANGQIQISASGVPATTKTVIVNQISDFPAAVGGVITLADDTEYNIRNDLALGTTRFGWGENTVMDGADSAVVSITYTGAGVMNTITGKTAKIKGLTLSAANGQLFSVDGLGTKIFQMQDLVVSAATLGTLANLAGLQIDNVQHKSITVTGYTFSGAFGVVLVGRGLNTVDAGTLFDLGTTTFNALSIAANFTTLAAGTVFLNGAANSANMNAGTLATVHDSRFFGAGDPLSGIAAKDHQWHFTSNDGITDSHSSVLMTQTGNATATVIAAVNTPVKLAGAWVEDSESHFTTDATGKMTYAGVRAEHIDITASFHGGPVSGGTKTLAYYMAVNGVVIAATATTVEVASGTHLRSNLIWHKLLQPGDYVEFFAENQSDTVNVIVTDAILRLS